jgi:hypothetical protein
MSKQNVDRLGDKLRSQVNNVQKVNGVSISIGWKKHNFLTRHFIANPEIKGKFGD